MAELCLLREINAAEHEKHKDEKEYQIARPNAKSGRHMLNSFCGSVYGSACHGVYISTFSAKIKEKAQEVFKIVTRN